MLPGDCVSESLATMLRGVAQMMCLADWMACLSPVVISKHQLSEYSSLAYLDPLAAGFAEVSPPQHARRPLQEDFDPVEHSAVKIRSSSTNWEEND